MVPLKEASEHVLCCFVVLISALVAICYMAKERSMVELIASY